MGLLTTLARRSGAEVIPDYDPGRERRAERRARELMGSVVGPEMQEMYEQLGFLSVIRPTHGEGEGGYGYLIYPHRPIVAFDTASGSLRSGNLTQYSLKSSPVAVSKATIGRWG